MLIINPWKSCFHKNLQYLTMNFWGPPPDPHWNEIIHICIATQHALPTEGSLKVFSLYIKGTKKLALCLIVLISLFQVKCTFFMVYTTLKRTRERVKCSWPNDVHIYFDMGLLTKALVITWAKSVELQGSYVRFCCYSIPIWRCRLVRIVV